MLAEQQNQQLPDNPFVLFMRHPSISRLLFVLHGLESELGCVLEPFYGNGEVLLFAHLGVSQELVAVLDGFM